MKKNFEEYVKFIDQQKAAGRSLDATDLKSHLRKAVKAERAKIAAAAHQNLSAQMCEIALMVSEVQSAQTVALYVSYSSEPSTYPLLDILKRRGKDVILPVLGESFTRTWAPFVSASDLHTPIEGRPPEPSRGNLSEDAIGTADVILAPALAVDTQANRLGHGGGWYDRVLLKKRSETKVFTLVFDGEFFDLASLSAEKLSAEGATADIYALPHEVHDIRVDGCITPSQFYRF